MFVWLAIMNDDQRNSGIRQVEISSFDLRYEHCRLKSKVTERSLLSSILDHGIRDPLRGVETKDGCRILLDGFKRYRCAKKLSIGIVPYHCLGEDEAFGIITLLRIANAKSLSILEQARLIDELNTIHKMSVSQIVPSKCERIPSVYNRPAQQNMANCRILRLEQKVDRLSHQIENILKAIHIDNPSHQ